MKIVEYLKKVNKKIDILDKRAQNPFLKDDFKYNPFRNSIYQTYVWVEDVDDKKVK